MPPLTTAVAEGGPPLVSLGCPDGSRLVALPASGRLLGLFPPGSDENFFWTHPAPGGSGKTWPNPGGDRTWLAPEVELFIGDLKRPWETYAVPTALDPGHWTLSAATATELCLTNATRLRLHRAGRKINVQLGKCFRPAANPLPDTGVTDAGLQYAGYRQVTTLELEPTAGAAIRLGIWNLLQLPSPGVMLISLLSAAQPKLVFGTLSDRELTVGPQMVRWEMAAPGADAKIAIKARALTGRAGYLRRHTMAGTADLVVREFAVDPAGDYVDALWEHPHEAGWGFQACCVRVGPERFNELEYHAPAVTAAAGGSRGRDESRVWAFRGPAAAIAEAARVLLGAELKPE